MSSQVVSRTGKYILIMVVIATAIFGLGCSVLSGASDPTATDAPTVQPDPPTHEPIPIQPDPTQKEAPTPERPLGTGPWLLIEAEDGMWAVNADGSGLVQLTFELALEAQDLERSDAPQGGQVALITSSDPDGMSNLTLRLLSLLSGNFETITPLTSGETEPGPDEGPGDPAFEVVRTLSSLHNLEWSPDGRQLAFMGAMQGPTSDLYLFSLDSGDIVQLTDGPSQGIRPTWSPDGVYIVHAGVATLGTGAGYSMDGIWAARSDNSEVVTLYPIPEDSGDEGFLGWVSPSEILVHTWSAICGLKNLRIYDISTGNTEVLWEDYFSSVKFSPETGTALIGVDKWTVDCNPSGSDATYLLEPGQATPLQVLDLGSTWMDWYPSARVFLVKGEEKMFAIWPEGEVRRLVDSPGTQLPVVSSDGRMWAFAETTQGGAPGLWLGAFGDETQKIFSGSCRHATWSPGGEGLFFFADDGLYYAPEPNFTPTLIGPGLQVTRADPTAWVSP